MSKISNRHKSVFTKEEELKPFSLVFGILNLLLEEGFHILYTGSEMDQFIIQIGTFLFLVLDHPVTATIRFPNRTRTDTSPLTMASDYFSL